ncbi:zinc finger protein (CCHC)-12 [Ciona intestinalis]
MISTPQPLSRDVAVPLSDAEREKRKEEEPKKQSREEWRKKKELEEARKLGNAPAEVDEEGKDINPHIPQYISTVPWYVDPSQRASLKHQRCQPEKQVEFNKMNDWYRRGVADKPIATKFRKGACANCGAMTHKKRDCLERPRRVGAKYTGEEIAPDEHLQPDLNLDFDGKRDRWNGYNPNQHKEVIEEYKKIEIAKQTVKAKKLQEELISGKMEEGGSDDEDKYADAASMPGTNFDSKQRITVRNLRIREDTAKYLRNLNPNSAYYDPKTRSMRENPYEGSGKGVAEGDFAGDNFVRHTGDTHEMARTQMFAWEAGDRGVEVHLQADPTRLEMLQKSFHVRKDDFKKDEQQSILAKYGGLEHLDAPPKELLLAQTEDYVEYSRQGNIIKGQEKAKTKSKYIEDVYVNNHTHVWGSYWHAGIWGYACCHSTVKQSYCTGEAGKDTKKIEIPLTTNNESKKETKLEKLEKKHSAWTKALGIEHEVQEEGDGSDGEGGDMEAEEGSSDDKDQPKSLLQQHREKLKEDMKEKKRRKKREKKKKRRKQKKRSSSSSDSDSDAPPEQKIRKKMLSEAEQEKIEKERKLKQAVDKEKQRVKRVNEIMKLDERDRPYNSMADIREPTKDEMEAYMMKKQDADDPMAKFISK